MVGRGRSRGALGIPGDSVAAKDDSGTVATDTVSRGFLVICRGTDVAQALGRRGTGADTVLADGARADRVQSDASASRRSTDHTGTGGMIAQKQRGVAATVPAGPRSYHESYAYASLPRVKGLTIPAIGTVLEITHSHPSASLLTVNFDPSQR